MTQEYDTGLNRAFKDNNGNFKAGYRPPLSRPIGLPDHLNPTIEYANLPEIVNPSPLEEIIVARDYGFCGGVPPAIDLALRLFNDGKIVYTDNDVAHNRPLSIWLEEKGLRNVGDAWMEDDFDGHGQRFLISAHGTSEERKRLLEEKGFDVWDATCRLVENVHLKIRRSEDEGFHTVYRGVEGHPETRGSLGSVKDPANITLIQSVDDIDRLDKESGYSIPHDKRIIMYSQTTLMPSDVEDCEAAMIEKYKDRLEIVERGTICPATINRQIAVEEIAPLVDLFIVVGSAHSHNSQELARVARRAEIPVYLIDTPVDIDPEWFKDAKKAGLTAGASVLPAFFEPIQVRLLQMNPNAVLSTLGESRDKLFKLVPATELKLAARVDGEVLPTTPPQFLPNNE